MSRPALQVADPTPVRRSDPVFGIAAGLYLALLLSPAVLLAVSVTGWTEPGVLYGTFLVTGVGALALAGLVFSRHPGLVPRLGSSPLAWLPAVMGVVVAAGALATFEYAGGLSVLGAFFGLFAALVGTLLGALARSRYANAVLEDAAEQLAFEAGWPQGPRNRVYAVAGVVAGLSAIGWLAGVVAGFDWLVTLCQMGFSLGLVTSVVGRSRTYRVTSAGLAVDEPLRTRLLPWSAFEGWDRTDDAIEVRRPWRVDVRLATDDLADPDAVADALARHLPARA
ncbi:PH domain-containing protein [Halomicrobium zhouii]|uniref:PH domain-containing protein n=1 Tax=Halomicrobium zhouii TaxID=767519 RepID=A0A1I6KQU7_9EURY|nr:PH domain-containing protein [Halomicrobium zhouii]SFR93632.1 PH domain-containing protein [Halomicrobium zhouii]